MAFDPENAGVSVATRTADPEEFGVAVQDPSQVTSSVAATTPVGRGLRDYDEANTRPGIPLDYRASLPAAVRARVSIESDLGKQLELLKKQPGILDARVDSRGKSIIATVRDEAGQEKDVFLHPPMGFTGGDIAGAAAPLAKIGTSTGLALATAGSSLLPSAFIMGGGTAATDALMKEGSRLQAGMDLDPKDLAKSAAVEGGLNAALPVAGVVAKRAAGILSRGAGALEKSAVEAGARQAIPITPAQATGSGALARSSAMPGTGGAALAAEQEGALRAAMDRQVGLSGLNAVPTEAEIASQVQPRIAAASNAAETTATNASRGAATAAQDEIRAQLDKGLVPSAASPTDAGAAIRTKVEAARDAFQAAAQKNYGEAYALAEKEGLRVPTDAVTKLALQISEKDPQGALQQLVPEVTRVFKLEQAINQGVSLPQAVELRALVNDQIARGTAVGSIPDRYLKQLASALTESIDQGVAKGSPELRAAYDTAKQAYAKDIGNFTSSDIAKLFTDPDSGRYLGDSEIIPALFRGRGNLDALQAYKNVLGANSANYKLLLRQGADTLLDEAGTTGGLVNADRFLSRLNSLSSEMRKELLGDSADAIVSNARIAAAAGGNKIDPVDLETALKAAPGNAPKLFQEAVERQAAFDRDYGSTVMKGIRDGTFGDRSVTANPDTFVTRFLKNASTADVKQVQSQLTPETNALIQQRTLANIMADVRAKAATGEATTGGSVAINPDKLVQDYLTGTNRAKYEAVLGKDGIQFLDDLATINEAMAKEALQASGPGSAERIAGSLGSLLGGERIGGSMARAGVRALAAGPRFALGNAQRSEAVRNYLTTGELPNLNPLARTAILAAPQTITERRRALAQRAPEPKE